MILFWLKKFVSFWLMPLPFCLTLLAVGWWLAGRPRGARAGRRLLGAGLLLLLLFSNKEVSTRLLAPLEARYPAIPELAAGVAPPELAGCRYVVVLGGGHSDTPGLSAADKLSTSALARLTEAVRLLRVLPAARLIVSGPAAGAGLPTHASVLTAAAVSLGVPPGRITRIETAHDTEDEAAAVKALVGLDRIALVTSAWHMPRAAALFRDAGVDFVACPTDYVARPPEEFQWSNLSWDTESLDRSTRAVHESLGYFWLWLRRKV